MLEQTGQSYSLDYSVYSAPYHEGLNRAVQEKNSPEKNLEAWNAAQDFEAVFLTQMLKPMFDQISTDGLMGGGQGEKIFRSMLVQEYGKSVAQNGGVGIAVHVYDEILKLQEV